MGNKWGLALAINTLRDLASYQGDYAAAHVSYDESVALFREVGDRWGLSGSLRDVGWLAMVQGDTKAARAALGQEIEDKRGLAASLNLLAEVARYDRDYERTALYDASLTLNREMGSKFGIALVLHNQGRRVRHVSAPARAVAHFRESLALARELADVDLIANCLAGVAGVVGARRQPARAARLFGAAEALWEASYLTPDPVDRREIECDVAAIHTQLGDETWVAAWAEGRAMSLEQAIASALDADLLPDRAPRTAP